MTESGSGGECPGCGRAGDGDDVLANDQMWCANAECRVVSFQASGGESNRSVDTESDRS